MVSIQLKIKITCSMSYIHLHTEYPEKVHLQVIVFKQIFQCSLHQLLLMLHSTSFTYTLLEGTLSNDNDDAKAKA